MASDTDTFIQEIMPNMTDNETYEKRMSNLTNEMNNNNNNNNENLQ